MEKAVTDGVGGEVTRLNKMDAADDEKEIRGKLVYANNYGPEVGARQRDIHKH